MTRFEIYPEIGSRGFHGVLPGAKWRWRLKARNGKIIADSGEAYNSKEGVRKAVFRLHDVFPVGYTGRTLPIVEVTS